MFERLEDILEACAEEYSDQIDLWVSDVVMNLVTDQGGVGNQLHTELFDQPLVQRVLMPLAQPPMPLLYVGSARVRLAQARGFVRSCTC